MTRPPAVLALLLAACATPGAPDAPDAADAPDLAAPADLAEPTVDDLAAPDLATPPDLSRPPDLARPLDLLKLPDLARPPDLADAATPDLAPPPDLLPPADLTCIPMCTAGACNVANGCGGTCQCGAGQGCVAQQCRALPQSWSSPGVPSLGPVGMGQFGGAFARAFRLQLDADDPTATVYYTTDGNTPTLASPSAAVPASFTVSATTTVKYFARTAAGAEPTIHSETFGVSAANQPYAGWIVEDLDIAGSGGVATVSAGQTVNATATIQLWVQSTSPGNSEQLVYGVDDTDQGCLYSGAPGVWPGATVTNKAFQLTAPMAPGVHLVRVAYIQDLNCIAAMQNNPTILKTRPNAGRVGILIVQ